MSRIEWCDITRNPVTGKCPMGCGYCYAERMRKRFKQPEITAYHSDRLELPKAPCTVFWGSVYDLFAPTVDDSVLNEIFEFCTSRSACEHTHIFLTHTDNHARMADYAMFGAEGKIYFGVSLNMAFGHDADFVSLEPLTDATDIYAPLCDVSCVIIGGLTGFGSPYKHLSLRTLAAHVEDAFAHDVRVFIKDNIIEYIPSLFPLAEKYGLAPEKSTFRRLPWSIRAGVHQ